MRTISNILAAVLLLSSGATAQQVPEMGFIRIVNAIAPGTGNARFLIDGEDLHAGGYALGQTTGGYPVARGARTIGVRKDGVGAGSTRVDLATGETMTVIAFAERAPERKPGEPPRWNVKLLRLKQQEHERGYGLSIVPVAAAAEIALEVRTPGKAGSHKLDAPRLRISKVDLGKQRADLEILAGGAPVTTISPDSRGNYVVILFEKADGSLGAVSYYDPKFVVAG